MSEQEQEKERPSAIDKRSSAGGKKKAESEKAPPAEAEDIETLKAQLEEEKKKAETYLANWQRAAADFQNFKRRTDQEREDVARLANAALIINVLPILDDMERALTSVDVRLAGLTWVDGIRLIYRKFQAILEASGVNEIKAEGLYRHTAQAFAVLLPVQSVGVMGDARTYENALVVRCVDTDDFMTADWSRLPSEVLARIATRIINEVKGVNRVCYDISTKPPATIEWE